MTKPIERKEQQSVSAAWRPDDIKAIHARRAQVKEPLESGAVSIAGQYTTIREELDRYEAKHNLGSAYVMTIMKNNRLVRPEWDKARDEIRRDFPRWSALYRRYREICRATWQAMQAASSTQLPTTAELDQDYFDFKREIETLEHQRRASPSTPGKEESHGG